MASIVASFSSLNHFTRTTATATSSSASRPIITTPLHGRRFADFLATTSSKKLPLVLAKAAAAAAAIDEETPTSEVADQPFSVAVSPSDLLTMFFQAEGTMNETAIPSVTRALEDTDGITNLKVQLLEGIASVEFTKQTTVQATGVASSLIETIQGSGFKLQTLNLCFEDDEAVN